MSTEAGHRGPAAESSGVSGATAGAIGSAGGRRSEGGAPPSRGAAELYRVLMGIAAVCGLVVVFVYQVTEARVLHNQRQARQLAVTRVVPGSVRSVDLAFDPADGFRRASAGEAATVFAGYDERGVLVGWAIQAQGPGYQDVIRLLYGYSPSQRAIVGMVVLESRETPGLGDAIESPAFAENFRRLDVTLEGKRLAHAIELVAPGKKQHPWQVDAISGATVSSRAVAQIVGDSASRWLPRIPANMEDFQP